MMEKDNIGFSQGLKSHGNINRILEMARNNLGDNLISAHFKDEGVNISPQFVKAIRTEIHEFSRKAVSKKSTKTAIKGINADRDNKDSTSNHVTA